jgi:deoxyribodipyrimidine photolyase-related protein
MKSIILILGDQLSFNISSLKNCDKENDLILMCEVMQECTTPKHHKKKIAFILSSMRHFWQKLQNDGFNVSYSKLDDPENSGSFKSEILRISKKYQINKIKITHPGEYRVLQELNSLKQENLDIEIVPDDRFLCGIGEFEEFAKGKKNLLMESFYHYMRLKHNILMDGKKPIGGK